MPSSAIVSRTPIADVFGLLWDVVAFFLRHFFDILELLFVVVVLGVGVAIAAAATGTASSLTDMWRRWRARAPERPTSGPATSGSDDPWRVDDPRSRESTGSAPRTQRPPPATRTRAPSTYRPPASAWAPPTTAPNRTTRPTPPSAKRPVLKCPAERNKTVFDTEAKADAKVAQSKRRFELHGGQPPLDHSYECPHGFHWHVSSKPRY